MEGKEAKRDKEVFSARAGIENEVSILEKLSEELIVRMEPVLRQQEPKLSGAKDGEGPPSFSAPLAVSLNDYKGRLVRANRNIRDVLARAEI